MKLVILNRGYTAKVSDRDHPELSKYKWSVYTCARHQLVYARRREANKLIWMHRAILGITDPKVKVDHRDTDGLNNQRRNLRASTQQQNTCNQRKCTTRPMSSKFKGVTLFKGLWQARIGANGTRFFLGYHSSEEAAAVAYNRAAQRLHKSFARLNEV